MKEALSEKKVEFEYVEITDSMKNLKRFLKIRDTRDEYKVVRRVHAAGIPMLMIDDEIHLGPSQEKLDDLFD